MKLGQPDESYRGCPEGRSGASGLEGWHVGRPSICPEACGATSSARWLEWVGSGLAGIDCSAPSGSRRVQMVRYGVVRRAAVVGEGDRALVSSYRNASVGARADVVAASRPDCIEDRVYTTCLGWVHVGSTHMCHHVVPRSV